MDKRNARSAGVLHIEQQTGSAAGFKEPVVAAAATPPATAAASYG
jgi:hypothetical protein